MKVEFRTYTPGTKSPGSVTTFLRKFHQGAKKRGEVKVPCDGCNACCRSSEVEVELTSDEASQHGGIFDAEHGWLLPKNADGTCVKLIDGKCSIYADRPFTCRTYDCRWLLLIGMHNRNDPVMSEAIKQWASFSSPTSEDKDTYTAIRLAIADGGMPQGVEEAMRKATRWRNYLAAAGQVRRKLDGLTADQRRQLVAAFDAPPT